MTDDTYTPVFLCKKCGKQSYPLGKEPMHMPILDVPVTCPYCGHKTNYEWISPEIRNEIIKKKAGLIDNLQENLILKKHVETLDAKVTTLSSEIELLKARLELLTKDEIHKIKENLGNNASDIVSLIEKVNDLKEKVTFQEENK